MQLCTWEHAVDAAALHTWTSERRQRVLLIQADGWERRQLARTLRRSRYEVLELEDGLDLQCVISDQLDAAGGVLDLPELIISDMESLGACGLYLLERFHHAAVAMRLILLAERVAPETCAQACRVGASLLLSRACGVEMIGHAAQRLTSEP